MRQQLGLLYFHLALFELCAGMGRRQTHRRLCVSSGDFLSGWIAGAKASSPSIISTWKWSYAGASTYMAALASGNIQVLYGRHSVSRAIATGGFDLTVIATETRYIPLRLMVVPSIRSPADLRGKKLGVGRAGLDEYATLLYLEKLGLTPGKDVELVYMAGGVPSRAAAMKQGLIHGVTVNPPNEYELEKAGYHEFANFLDFKMPYAGVPHTVSRAFRDKNRQIVEDYMTAVVEGMRIFRTNKQAAFKAITELTRQSDAALLERTYESYAKQYDAFGGIPLPWQSH